MVWRKMVRLVRGRRWTRMEIEDMLWQHYSRSRQEFDAIHDRWEMALRAGDDQTKAACEHELRMNYRRYCELAAFQRQIELDWGK